MTLPAVLTVTEVADLFNVDRKTVIRWVQTGKISGFKTPGGQHRFLTQEIQSYLEDVR